MLRLLLLTVSVFLAPTSLVSKALEAVPTKETVTLSPLTTLVRATAAPDKSRVASYTLLPVILMVSSRWLTMAVPLTTEPALSV